MAGRELLGSSRIAGGALRGAGRTTGFGVVATTEVGLGAGLVTFSCSRSIDADLLGSSTGLARCATGASYCFSD